MKEVIIMVSGGVTELESAPEYIRVVLKDYDYQNYPFDDVAKDDYGHYVEVILQEGMK